MATINLIEPSSLPGGVTSYGGVVQEAITQLKLALRHDQALKITPEPYERTAHLTAAYRKAAKEVGIRISIRQVGVRAFHTASGERREEACELYVLIVGAAPKPEPPPPAPSPRTVDTSVRPPITIAPAQFERTPVPGLEVSR